MYKKIVNKYFDIFEEVMVACLSDMVEENEYRDNKSMIDSFLMAEVAMGNVLFTEVAYLFKLIDCFRKERDFVVNEELVEIDDEFLYEHIGRMNDVVYILFNEEE